ncbi:hypothetical protein K1719_020576 [Acacia pycnantha]|nr:hypothetical protein K1719_020576 [Acacia pycnantha]
MNKAKHEKRSNKCFVFLLAAFVILCAITLVFASLVLRVKRPLLQFESVSVNHLSHTTLQSSPSFNLTMVAQISVKNPNLGRFEYGNSSVKVLYGGSIVGDRELQSGRVKGRENRAINVSLNLRWDHVLSSGNLSSEILSRDFNLTAYTKLTGYVRLLKFFDKKRSTEMACLMRLNLTSNSVQNLQC